jgi:hypothetical protein
MLIRKPTREHYSAVASIGDRGSLEKDRTIETAACCISKINDVNAKIFKATLMVFTDTGTETGREVF